jgi:putative ABC transport system permease protein
MSLWLLVVRSLRFYWRTHMAVLLAVVVATGVLTGALVVGDSVQYTLRRTVEARLGRTEFAVVPQNRYFRAALADDLDKQLGGTVAPVLQVAGIVSNDSGSRRVNRVQVLGVDERFYAIGPGSNGSAPPETDTVVVSEAVAQRLDVAAGDELLLRVEKPGLMPRDVPLASDADRTIAFRLKVQAVAGDATFGRFDLKANQTAPLNVFVPLAWLAEQIEQPDRANMLLAAGLDTAGASDELNAALEGAWELADADLQLRKLESLDLLELRSRRIFIDEVLGDEALKADANAIGILTYFVNEIRLGEKATPYSMVTALQATDRPDALIPPGMRPDEIVINQWLADDLGAQVGDSLELTYYLVGPKRDLFERVVGFTVVKIVPLEGAAADPALMPDFPGLADAENCRDWEPGIPVDLDKIRPTDEAYWDDYRGTPKAFITLQAGQGIWRNRYGNLTAVRYPWREGLDREVAAALTREIDPATVGLLFQPVRQRGLQAGQEGTDFGQLFLGLSMFLIAAAVILTGLLFVFGVESRCSQVGLLMAVGLSSGRVKRLLMIEGALVALAGTVIGVGAGLLYTQLLVHGLSTLWSGAVAGTKIYFHAEPATLAFGALGGFAVALLAIWVTLRRHVTRSARELLDGHLEACHSRRAAQVRGRLGLGAAVVSLLSVIVFLAIMGSGNSRSASGAFFGAGALLLLGGLALTQAILRIVGGGWSKPMVSLGGLGFRNTTRRSGRSLAVVGLLACGVFMVVAVGANRHDPMADAESRQSGTGGFAFYGESSVAVLHDLNTEKGRSALGLDSNDLDGVEVVQCRVHEGDDASCLNLNRAQRPRLLGVEAKELARRGAFKFTQSMKVDGDEKGWELLRTDLDNGSIPAIGDYPTVYWALGKNIGDELEYTDEKGQVLRVRIVGMLESSILQGSLLIAENEFMARFPSESGYRVFLGDVPAEKAPAAEQLLTSGLQDFGLVLTPAKERLAAFSEVENTYLSIFTALGGLGLILGSIGLGLVVLRNMLERRGELAMLRAVGFDRQTLLRMIFYEHWGLVFSGLLCGVVAALVAVVPSMQSPGGRIPYVSLGLTVVAIGGISGLWVWIAGVLALRGAPLDALRTE